MPSETYVLPAPQIILHGFDNSVSVFRDADEVVSSRCDHTFVDLAVQSGDYFATLATQLDNLSQHLLPLESEAVQAIVRDLLYLQDSYVIKKK